MVFKMKKRLLLCIITILVFALCACSRKESSSAEATPVLEGNTTTEPTAAAEPTASEKAADAEEAAVSTETETTASNNSPEADATETVSSEENAIADSVTTEEQNETMEEPTEENTAGENTISEENSEETENIEISEEDYDKFATGADTGADASEESDSTPEYDGEADVLANEIEQRCPEEISATRDDIEYPTYTHGSYYSETCGMERGYTILLPTDYSEEKQYPVLYLLHGIFGDENSFAGDKSNKIREIVTNMYLDGYIEETIVVCPNMYATDDPKQRPAFDAASCLPYDNFINDLVNDLMPFIEANYQVLTGRENTYLAGFSMGGRETLFITLMRPELFGYVCAISAAPGIVETTDMFMSHPGQLLPEEVKFAEDAVEPEVFIVCCGTRDSVVGRYPLSYHSMLEDNGSAHIWYEIEGADHDNNAIKSGLYNLFKQISLNKLQN